MPLSAPSSLTRRNEDVPEGHRIELRIGINLGDIIVDGDDIYGDGVNVAARLEGLCEVGAVYVSAVVHDQVEGKIDVVFNDLGEHTVKNIDKPIGVYRVSPEVGSAKAVPVATDVDKLFDRPAVAVLPFENIGGDPEQEYFADGLTEDIITALSLWRTFPVIARNSTFAYKGTSPDIRKVGEELGAHYVIEGSVRKGGNRVRITVQLIDAETGHHVWAERYDRKLDDFFELQDEIAQAIAGKVEPEFAIAEQRRAYRKAPTDLASWEWYHRGVSALDEMTEDSNHRAQECFQRAIELDPTHSAANAAIAYCHYRYALDGYSESPNDDYSRTVEFGKRAVALDDSDAYAHFVLGVGYAYTGRHDLSIAEARRAIELNPNHATAHVGLGNRLNYTGKPEEGILHIELGMRLNPDDPRIHLMRRFLAEAHLNNRDYEKAVEWARKSIERNPDYALAHATLAASLGHLGRIAEAEAALKECLRLQPRTIANRRYSVVYERSVDAEHILDGLRKAGLPE